MINSQFAQIEKFRSGVMVAISAIKNPGKSERFYAITETDLF